MTHFKLKRFFTPRLNLRPGSSVRLEEDEAKHIRQSLRLKPGEQIVLFNGEAEFVATLGLVTKDVVMANIVERLERAGDQQLPYIQITLVQSLIKLNHFELVLEKCSELGVYRFQPIQAEFSQMQAQLVEYKRARLEKIILSACKQSESLFVPELKPATKLTSDLLSELKENHDLVVAATLSRQAAAGTQVLSTTELSAQLSTQTRLALLIGPEGGFSPTEHSMFSTNGIAQVEMFQGKILRSETAAIASVAALQELAK